MQLEGHPRVEVEEQNCLPEAVVAMGASAGRIETVQAGALEEVASHAHKDPRDLVLEHLHLGEDVHDLEVEAFVREEVRAEERTDLVRRPGEVEWLSAYLDLVVVI